RASLAACSYRELDPATAPEPLGLLGGRDLDSETGELLLEQRALSRRARHDHALDPRTCEPPDLIRDERPAGDVHERLRPAAGGLAHALGLATGKDDRLHYVSSSGSRSAVSGSTSAGELGRPMPS